MTKGQEIGNYRYPERLRIRNYQSRKGKGRVMEGSDDEGKNISQVTAYYSLHCQETNRVRMERVLQVKILTQNFR